MSLIRLYFLRGYSCYFSIPFSVINFTLIFYNLFILKLNIIPDVFKKYSVFVPLALGLLIPICVIIGHYDYHRGMFQDEQRKIKEISPIYKTIHKKLDRILNQLEDKT